MAAADSGIVVNNEPTMDLSSGKEAIKDMLFGSLAGMAGKIIEYPFDTVKVRLQSQPEHLPLRYTGPVDCFRQSLRSDGILGLYRGISAPMAGAAVETSCLFFSYRIIQDAVRVGMGVEGQLSFPTLLLCGALSGSVTSLVLTPIELVKCKMQVLESHEKKRHGPLKLVGSVFRQSGLLGFWRGQLGTLIRETGGSAAWFGSYEGVSDLFRRYHSPPLSSSPSSSAAAKNDDGVAPLPVHQQMMAGAVAGVCYNFTFYPADTIKSRMQTDDMAHHHASEKRTFWDVGRLTWRQHGLKGLYRGCGITVARAAPSSAFIFSVYEGLRNTFG